MISAVQSREDWLADRLQYLGGTDVAAIVGKHKYKTALDVFLEKTGAKVDAVSSRKAQAGLALEPLIRDWYAEEFGQAITPGVTVYDPEHKFLAVNPDGWIDEETLAEIKTMDFATRDEWGESGTDEIPMAYYVQCVWQLGITGAKRVIVIRVDRGTMEIETYVVDPAPELFTLCRREAIAFWLNKQKGIPPEPTAKDGDNLIHLFPKETGEVVLATEREDAWASEMASLRQQIKPLEARYDELKEYMKIAIGEASAIETLTGRFTLQRMAGKQSWQKVALALKPTPELLAEHVGQPYFQLKTPF